MFYMYSTETTDWLKHFCHNLHERLLHNSIKAVGAPEYIDVRCFSRKMCVPGLIWKGTWKGNDTGK